MFSGEVLTHVKDTKIYVYIYIFKKHPASSWNVASWICKSIGIGFQSSCMYPIILISVAGLLGMTSLSPLVFHLENRSAPRLIQHM